MIEILDRYEIKRTLARSAKGVVYEGWDPAIERAVAIKAVSTTGIEDLERQQMRRVAQAAGRLTAHPNVVAVFDYGETQDVAFIVMEFVNGPTLKDVMAKVGWFALPDVVQVMQDVLNGLEHLHTQGVVHRNIKPDNLMLTSWDHQARIKISGFDIAWLESSSTTQAGLVIGTPAYMSPEQFMGESIDVRCDIYSCGVLLYQLLTGKRPFNGSLAEIMRNTLTTAIVPPSRLSANVSQVMDAVVTRAMAKRPDDRYPSAADFKRALLETFASRSSLSSPRADHSSNIASRSAALPFAAAFDVLLKSLFDGRKPPGVSTPPDPPPEFSGPSEEPARKQFEQREGSILWNPPARMKTGRRERLEVRVGDVEVAEKILYAGLRGKGIPQIDRLEVAPLMRVVLIADPADFSVLVLGNADQYIRPAKVARWDFDVTPLRSGRRLLRILVSMRVKVEGKDEIVDLPSFEREVEVAVAPLRATGRFCAQNWKWVAGSIVIPIIVWIAGIAGLLDAGSRHIREFLK